MTNREVKYAKFHAGLFIPGGPGNVGDTLPSSSKTLNVKMFATAEGLFVNANNVEALVPWPNVIVAVYVADSHKVGLKAL